MRDAYHSSFDRPAAVALQGRRGKVVLETKFGFDIDPISGKCLGVQSSNPAHIKQVVEAQLRRLRTDLLIQHRVDPQVPIEDVAGTIKDLVAAGKVLPLCEELGIGFVCWSTLGTGFLTGSVHADTRFEMAQDMDFRAVSPRFAPEGLPANMALVVVVRSWAQRKRATPAQLALAWLLAQKPWMVPIPGTTQVAHMEENLGAAVIRFTADELRQLNAAVAAIQGARLPDAVLQLSGVEAAPKH